VGNRTKQEGGMSIVVGFIVGFAIGATGTWLAYEAFNQIGRAAAALRRRNERIRKEREMRRTYG
jgi:hypothetical protein